MITKRQLKKTNNSCRFKLFTISSIKIKNNKIYCFYNTTLLTFVTPSTFAILDITSLETSQSTSKTVTACLPDSFLPTVIPAIFIEAEPIIVPNVPITPGLSVLFINILSENVRNIIYLMTRL